MQSRRDFLRTTALAAAGAPLAAALDGSSLHRPRKDRLGFALVGLGTLSTGQLAPALQKTQHCRLAAIVTGTPAKAERWKAQYALPDRSIYNYQTMERLADNPDVDVVYVVTPNGLHAEHTIKAARAGKHVLCEKPMEVSTERCQAMIDACRSAGRQLAIAYRNRFDPTHLEAYRIARDRELGAVKLLDAGFAVGLGLGNTNVWRFNRALSGGGPLVDVGIYALQTARMIAGEEPVQVVAQTTAGDPAKYHDVEASVAFQLTFPGGMLATCQASYAFWGLTRFTAYAEHGVFGLDPAYNYDGNHAFRSDGKPMQQPAVDQFAAEMDDFARCIMTGTPTKVPGEEGLRDMRLMTAIYEAARTGRAVRVG